jgi:sigma-E factor negative regulatory protein RseC
MIEQQGRVVSVRGDFVDVRLGGSSGCAACDAGKGCGAGVFGLLLRRRPMVVPLENTVGARPGQPVMVGMPETLFLRLVSRLYLLPLLAGAAGAIAGNYAASAAGLGAGATDAATFIGGAAAGLAFVFTRRNTAREFPASTIVHLLRVAAMEESIN